MKKMLDKLKSMDKVKIISLVVWTFLIVRYEAVRNFLLGMLLGVVKLWGLSIKFVLGLVALAIIAFVIVQIGIKIKLIDTSFMDKLHKTRVEFENKREE